MKPKIFFFPFLILGLFSVSQEKISSQNNNTDISGWIDSYEPMVKASFKRPPQWLKRDVSRGVFFAIDKIPNDYGRITQATITIDRIEDSTDVENFLKRVRSGEFQKYQSDHYVCYEGVSVNKGTRMLHVYIEVEKNKRYIACWLMPYSSAPEARRVENQFRAMTETFRFDGSSNPKSHFKVD